MDEQIKIGWQRRFELGIAVGIVIAVLYTLILILI